MTGVSPLVRRAQSDDLTGCLPESAYENIVIAAEYDPLRRPEAGSELVLFANWSIACGASAKNLLLTTASKTAGTRLGLATCKMVM